MEVRTSNDPAAAAGGHVSTSLQAGEQDVICLLSGGSALDVIEHIHLPETADCSLTCCAAGNRSSECRTAKSTSSDIVANKICSLSECRTIFMPVDERVSREAKTNNTLQLLQRYEAHPVAKKLLTIIPNPKETPSTFAERVEKNFLHILEQKRTPKIIVLLGIGSDGHTAGIFPLPAARFQEVYPDDRTYVPVHVEGLRIDSRASFTPQWLLNNADELIGFSVGQSKREILESLIREDKKIHERPAEILKLHKHATLYTDIDLTT